MTHSAGLDTVDFNAFRTLLEGLLPPGSLCALSDAGGRVHYADPGFQHAIVDKVLARLASEPAASARSQPRIVRVRIPPSAWLAAPLRGDDKQPFGYLWACVPMAEDSKAVGRRLVAVASVLGQQARLAARLDDLSAELAERCEELNLVLYTEDQVSAFAEGQHALDDLVRNCRDYLGVRFAALLMRDKGILIAHDSSAADEAAMPQQRREALRTRIYDLVAQTGDTVLVNDPADPLLAELCPGNACRLLATPIVDGKAEVIGMLAISNDAQQREFSDNDKNLLRVMAQKAVKIVQVGYDSLTGLVNREAFEFLVGQQLNDAQQRATEHSVLFLDIDQLQLINDTVAHDAGDGVIKSLAALLQRAVRDADVVARLGGDEFGVLLVGCPMQRAEDIAAELRTNIAALVVPWADRSLSVTVSVGVAPVDASTETAQAAVAAAELACDVAKELGKNRVHSYQPTDTRLLKRHHEMDAAGQIQMALHQDRFELYGQPIEALDDPGAPLHVEALLRMRDDDGELVSPAVFLPAAERYHMMPAVDRWVVTRAVQFLNAHGAQFGAGRGLLAINLSGQSLSEPAFRTFLEERLAELEVPLDRICFEITETAVVSDPKRARAFMSELKSRGCKFALDDFGSGLSSFGYLRSLPVDYLKIDGSLVREIGEDPIAASMVAAVQQVAQVMHLKTVAEFVENEAIRAMAKKMGVSFAQGYAIGKPQPLDSFVLAQVVRLEIAAGR
jgi:diguanylate cyclase (GGDEF)-like protein